MSALLNLFALFVVTVISFVLDFLGLCEPAPNPSLSSILVSATALALLWIFQVSFLV
jgi:ABC-type dipeptide/oligopeptide/nickel transport system permease subunit